MRDVWDERIVGVRVRQHRADRKKYYIGISRLTDTSGGGVRAFGDRECRRPLVPQDIQTDRPVRVDVRMVDLGREADLGRLKRVIGGEGDRKEKDAARIWGISLK